MNLKIYNYDSVFKELIREINLSKLNIVSLNVQDSDFP